jgi:hypothetical protein
VQDARYWRGQAALCLELARQMSDVNAADRMRVNAAQYFAKATEWEKDHEAGASAPALNAATTQAPKLRATSRFFYNFSDGIYREDTEGEEHPDIEAAVAAAHQCADELARNRPDAHGTIILKNQLGEVVAEVPLKRGK